MIKVVDNQQKIFYYHIQEIFSYIKTIFTYGKKIIYIKNVITYEKNLLYNKNVFIYSNNYYIWQNFMICNKIHDKELSKRW